MSVGSRVLTGAREFVAAVEAAGIPRGDYNGNDRGGSYGVVSLLQTTTRGVSRTTYRAFLEGDAARRTNLRIITDAQVTRALLKVSLVHRRALSGASPASINPT